MLLILLILQSLAIACYNEPVKSGIKKVLVNESPKVIQSTLAYNYENPEILVLDKTLVEISGLAYKDELDGLLTHNDEKGIVYEISKDDGSIIKESRFGKKGDYESIEFYDHKYVVCTSSGNLHLYDPVTKRTEKIKTSLSSKNDIEGMCLSTDNKFLLLACKGQSLEKSKSKKLKAVYAFDLQSRKLIEDPYIKITDDDLIDMVNKEYGKQNNSNSELKKLIKRAKEFSPSGIAIHPQTKQYYLISARGSTVVILDRDKSLEQVIFLNDRSFKQPEGICFDKSATMYISLEGRGLKAKILKFKKV